MIIRPATVNDIDILFEWVNRFDSIKWKFRTCKKAIKSEHEKWFYESLLNRFCRIWIIQSNKKKNVGQIRIKLNKNIAEVDIYVDDKYRGKGYGFRGLSKAIELFSDIFTSFSFQAIIHQDNISSKNLFLNNGFKLKSIHKENWELYTLLPKKRSKK